MRSSRPGGLAQLSAGLWLSATELETWGLLRAVQSLSPNVFFERFVEAPFPVRGHQANSSAPVPVEPKSLEFERRTIALAPISRLCVEPYGSFLHACTDRNSTGNGRAADRTSGDTASDTRQSNGAAA
jgi:hypothetical protein